MRALLAVLFSLFALVMISLQPIDTGKKQSKYEKIRVTDIGLERSERWFRYDGKYIYFVGADLQSLVADPKINYVYVLDQLKRYRINKIRVWIYCYWGGAAYLHPWQYSSATGKFDLDTWNPMYWHRLRNVTAAAQRHNIIVEVSIFGMNNIASRSDWFRSDWRNAWNKEFNVNGVFGANANGHFLPQFFDLTYPEKSLSGKTLKDYQQALLDKTVDELGSFTNVYFEVANEFPIVFDTKSNAIDELYPWQLYWAHRIKTTSGRLVAVHSHQGSGPHTHGVQYFWDQPDIDVLNFHFYEADPASISKLLHAAQTKGKIISENESFEIPAKLDEATREAWACFLSGGYYGFYQSSKLVGTSDWLPFAQRAKALRNIAERLHFWEMSPVGRFAIEHHWLISRGPAAGWQLMANPGTEYLAYFWGEQSSSNVLIQLPPGDYRFEWFDPRNEGVLLNGRVVANRTASIKAPAMSAWSPSVGLILVIRIITTVPTPLPS